MVIINVSVSEKPLVSDAMSARSQRGRVTFCEDIEMDSLEPEVNGASGKSELGTIKEYENEFIDESVDAFREYDVSVLSFLPPYTFI
jgi:hypothetical protein